MPSLTQDIAATRALLDSSQNHAAFEYAQSILRDLDADLSASAEGALLRYCAALAAARGGAREVARDFLDRLRKLPQTDRAIAADVESLSGRLAKDACIEAQDPALHITHASEALTCYLRADALHTSVYAKINAASLAALVGDDRMAESLATTVLASVEAAAEQDHWTAATRAEAMLLLSMPNASQMYAEAHRLAGKRYGDIASMRRQLKMLLDVRPRSAECLARIPGPNVVAFSGHMIDAANRAAPRFPAHIEAAVRAEIEREIAALLPVVAYTQAANGSDLLFCEALLAHGQEVNIVLPFGHDDYLAQSVLPGGESWRARFEAVLERASSVRYATDGHYLGDDTLFEHTSDLIQGLACLRAQALSTTPTMLVVADPSQSGATGGALATLAAWQARGHAHRVIDLKPLRERAPAPAGTAAKSSGIPAQKPTPLAGGRHIRALLFADVKGFSKLEEEYCPTFFSKFLGMVPTVLDRHQIVPLEMSSRGDGLYMVFKTLEDAARFSWALSQGIGEVDWTQLGMPSDTHVRIALHAGPVNRTLAHYGSHVTRAARLEPIVVPGQILVTEPFAAVLAAQATSEFACELVGVEPLAKGYGELRLYRLRLAG